MAEWCFKEKNSEPPICGVHKVPLYQSKTPIDRLAPFIGHVSCLICPISELVVLDSNENEPSKAI